jgi:hypothetical protein
VPAELLDLLRTVMRAVNAGEAVTVVVGGPEDDQELSSRAVADLLNVSRPFVVKLAKHGDHPHRMVGNRHQSAWPTCWPTGSWPPDSVHKTLPSWRPLRATSGATSRVPGGTSAPARGTPFGPSRFSTLPGFGPWRGRFPDAGRAALANRGYGAQAIALMYDVRVDAVQEGIDLERQLAGAALAA